MALVSKVFGQDDTTAAVKAVQENRALVAKLAQKDEMLHRQLHDAERNASAAALEDDPAVYEAAAKGLDRIALLIRRNDAAYAEANRREQEAIATLHNVGREKRNKEFLKKLTQSERIAAEYQETLEKLTSVHRRFAESRRQLQSMWVTGIPPMERMLHDTEIASAVANELWRENPVGSLSRPDESRTPGAAPNYTNGPNDFRPLVDVVKEADTALFDQFQTLPAPVEQAND